MHLNNVCVWDLLLFVLVDDNPDAWFARTSPDMHGIRVVHIFGLQDFG